MSHTCVNSADIFKWSPSILAEYWVTLYLKTNMTPS